MADKLAPLKGTSSYETLLRAADIATTHPVLGLLRTTHTGRVIEDGLSEGMRGLISSIVGIPKDLYLFAEERVSGTKSATPEAERILSSAWLEKKLGDVNDVHLKLLGRERPKLREGTADGLIHAVAKFAPVVGSFFIPGAGQTQLATAVPKISKVAGNIGFQMNALELTAVIIEGGENLAGIERPVETLAKTTPQSGDHPLIKAGTDTTAAFSDATASKNAAPKPQSPERIAATPVKFEM